jgi:4-hydroxythreonine-4-phosphate dehydrogenase
VSTPLRRALALTLGEPAGIGPDIAIRAWLAREREAAPPFLFVGDPDLLLRRAETLGAEIRTVRVEPADAVAAFAEALPCVVDAPVVAGKPGALDPADAPAVIDSIRRSVALVRSGEAAAVVTNPIQKKALQSVGFPFPGHTEFLGALSLELYGVRAEPVMMLAGPD